MIGAGFATGKELQLFFQNPNEKSLVYLCLSVLFMALISSLFFTTPMLSNRQRQMVDALFLLFSGVSCVVMFACGGETLQERFFLPIPWGNFITALLTLLIVSFGLKGVYRFNLIATPILFLSILCISIVGMIHPVGLFAHSEPLVFNLWTYAGYNLLSVLPFLEAIRPQTEKKEGIVAIWLGFFLVLIAGICLKLLLNLYHRVVVFESIPLLKIVGMIHPWLSYLYTLMLYLSVLTTAVNGLYAVTKGKNVVIATLLLSGFSLFGFVNLLGSLYPLFGYPGLVIAGWLIYSNLKSSKKKGNDTQWQMKKT